MKKIKCDNIILYDPIEKEVTDNLYTLFNNYNIKLLKSPMFLNGHNDNEEINK